MILTAGPWVSQKEVDYVMDAAKNGWNEHYADYVHRFEEEFAKYIGVKYAISTCGGTGALHLALASLGVGKGDEVILPDITYFSCSDVIFYLGAKPVFVDILKDTWCIDPEKIKKAITKRTKAIMPVHIYGNPADMDEIIQIARGYNLSVVEDACPAVGSIYKRKRPGSFGDFGAFSFQGAKIMVTGFGGMLVTNDRKLYDRAKFLNGHGELHGKKFWQIEVGYSHEMSNLQAAFALAQLERIESFVNKKRKIFDWYHKRLKDIKGISMNYERPYTKSNRWMSSIILDKDFGISRNEIIKKLKEKMIDSRPFFWPISMFPIFKEQNTHVAHHISFNGINLPSGLMRTEEEIDYVAKMLRKVLKV
ncbi:DegT/DnrJ/EryC1/StrS family aminotransferase [Candidatus Roizmanbacteria bacterium]|nr:DegT/DnrJ/EryC1/StrS family aminotransferase [Candidatus Roizmanbacteria bacterium]